MSIYNGVKATVNSDQFTTYIDLRIGVLQRLAPCLFVMELAYVMREALSDQINLKQIVDLNTL
jgi:hypothetical protein